MNFDVLKHSTVGIKDSLNKVAKAVIGQNDKYLYDEMLTKQISQRRLRSNSPGMKCIRAAEVNESAKALYKKSKHDYDCNKQNCLEKKVNSKKYDNTERYDYHQSNYEEALRRNGGMPVK